MSTAHIVVLPKPIWGLKVAQMAFSVLILALQAYCVSLFALSTSGFAIFAAIWSMATLTYYFVTFHVASCHAGYNWIAHLVLECLSVVFWLSAWACLASWYAALDYLYGISNYSGNTTVSAYSGTFLASLALSVINWIMYCVSLGFFGAAVHKHRMANKPITADGSSAEKHEMGRGPQSYNQSEFGPQPEYVNQTGSANRYP